MIGIKSNTRILQIKEPIEERIITYENGVIQKVFSDCHIETIKDGELISSIQLNETLPEILYYIDNVLNKDTEIEK